MASMSKDEMNAEVLECARYGEDDDLRSLLQAGANVNHKDDGGNTAIHKASANGEVGCLKILKEFGAIYCANLQGNLPIHWAAQNAKIDALQFLIDNYGDQIDMLAQNSFGRSTLTDAFQSQNESVIELCLSHSSSSEDRLMPKGSQAAASTLEGGIEAMNIASADTASGQSLSPEEEEEANVAFLEQHAVHHNMAFCPSDSAILKIRELPITRADDPFGTEKAPEDDTTGLGIWPAAVLAARWVATELREALTGKVVVELGCGVGLPGLAAAKYCNPKAVHLTDIHTPTLRNTVYNMQLNSIDANAPCDHMPESVFSLSQPFGPAGAVHAQIQSTDSAVPVSVSRVSWTDPLTYTEQADVLLGSDLVYDSNILAALTQAVAGLLSATGSFYYVAPDEGRDGMIGLIAALQTCGLECVEQKPCSTAMFANPLVEVEGAVLPADAYVLHFYDLAAQQGHSCYHFKRI